MKAACGKSARAVWAAGGGQREGFPERASPDPTPLRLLVALLGLALLPLGLVTLMAHELYHVVQYRCDLYKSDRLCVRFDAQTARTLQQVRDQSVGSAYRARLQLL